MRPRGFFLLIAGTLALGACDDRFGPQPWSAEPDTVVLYSMSRAELFGRPSAFDFVAVRRIHVEDPFSPGNWDIGVVESASAFVLMPSGAFDGVPPGPGIAELPAGSVFEQVERAPTDTAQYRRTEGVVANLGRIYVVRSRRVPGFFGAPCVYYAKMEPVEIDPVAGALWFRYAANPNCNDRALVPPR